MADHRISKEMIHPNVKEDVMASVGDISLLETEDKTNIVNAINSMKQNKIDKKLLVDTIGSPLEVTDTVEEMCSKIGDINDKFKSKLEEKGVDTTGVVGYNSLVDKVEEIKVAKRLPGWMLGDNIIISGEDYVTKITSAAVSSVGDYIYVFGGASSSSAISTVARYNTESNIWEIKSPMTSNRQRLDATTVGNYIYIIGGLQSSSTNKNECYDTITDTWTTKKSLPVARQMLTVDYVDGKIYAIAGSAGSVLVDNDCYDIISDTWTKKMTIPEAKYNHVSAVIENLIYVSGGMVDFSDKTTKTHHCYDTITNTWSERENCLKFVSGSAATAVGIYIHVFGGKGNSSSVNKTPHFCYDTINDSWVEYSEIPVGQKVNPVVCLVNSRVYIIGGSDTSDNLIYIPEM